MGKGEICNITIGNNFHVSIHMMDLKNVWKRKDINYLLDLKGRIQPYYKTGTVYCMLLKGPFLLIGGLLFGMKTVGLIFLLQWGL